MKDWEELYKLSETADKYLQSEIDVPSDVIEKIHKYTDNEHFFGLAQIILIIIILKK